MNKSYIHQTGDKFDVVVIGGGILGMSVSGFLASGGMKVALIDDGKGGGSTANAGSLHVQLQSRLMRMFPELMPGIERNLHLYPKAVAYWKKFEKALAADFDLKMTGGLMIAESPEQYDFLARKCEREVELGLEVQMLDRADLINIAPYLGEAVYGAEICAQEGKINPLLANAAIKDWAKTAGVKIVADTVVQEIEKNGPHYKVSWAAGSQISGKVVLAAGGGNRGLAARLGLELPVISEPLHMNITEPVGPVIGHLVQHAERPITLKQFSSGHIVIGGGWSAKLRSGDNYPTVELASIIGNTALAQHIIPQIAPLRIIRTWAGINATTDGRPVLGEFSALPGLYAAVSGDAGYTLGPLCARMLADQILGDTPTEDITDFTPDRYA